MTSWIEDEIARQQAATETRHAAISARAVERAALHSESQIVFKVLCEVLASDANLFNQTTKDHERKLSLPEWIGSRRFQIKRGYTPSFLLTVEFSETSVAVEYSIIRPSAIDQKLYQESGVFKFVLQNSGNAALTHNGRVISVGEASQILLRPAVEGFSRPLQ